MKNLFKKILKVFLVLAILTVCSVSMMACGKEVSNETNENAENYPSDEGNNTENPPISSDTYVRDGEYIYFGTYPQSRVTDEDIISALGTFDQATWTSYKYYFDKNQQEDCMFYIDKELNGYKYRGVYFTKHRAIGYQDFIYKYDDEDYEEYKEWLELYGINGYFINNIYWFKYEPIKWRVLDERDGKAFLFSEIALDSQAYQNSWEMKNEVYYNNVEGVPEGTIAIDYEYSTIRKWLNSDFYNTAFGVYEKSVIDLTEVDCSSVINNIEQKVNDNVFLLSVEEATNVNYGFVQESYAETTTRVKQITDYARVQNCHEITGFDEANMLCEWSLRYCNETSSSEIGLPLAVTWANGMIVECHYWDYYTIGVVPAIIINIE